MGFTKLKLSLPISRERELENLINQVIDLETRRKRVALDASHLLQQLAAVPDSHEIVKIKTWLRDLAS